MKAAKYWEERFTQLEAAQNRMGAAAAAEIQKAYDRAQRDISDKIKLWYQRFADNNGITMAEAKQWLKGKDLKEFKWDVREYIRHGEENAIDQSWAKELENASARWHISRYEALKIRMRESLEELSQKYQMSMDDAMSEVYRSGYYHTAFEVAKGVGVGYDIAAIDQSALEKVLSKPWAVDGVNFSERIWSNKQKLIDVAYRELTQGVMLGRDPQKTIDAIAKQMDASKSQVGRLVMTEEAYFASASRKDCFRELGVEKYVIVATLDNRTSEICQEMDGKVFKMSEYQPGVTAPPFHVNCRSTTAPYFEDMQGIVERAARDESGKVYDVPGSMTYKEWKAKFVDTGSSKTGIIKSLDVDDFNILAEAKEIKPEVSTTISDTIKEFEAKGGMYISAAEFGDFYDEATGSPALFQVVPNQYGMTVLNVNSRVLGGLSVDEADEKIRQTTANLPKTLKEAIVHECGHAKLIHGLKPNEVKQLYDELEKYHIDGISKTANSDGAECIAEVEVLLYRNDNVPDEAMKLYDRFVRKR